MGRREITELHRETDARGARGVTLICAAARGLPLGAARDAGGMDRFDDSAVIIKCRIKTVPMHQ
jgi:hypothetical protein